MAVRKKAADTTAQEGAGKKPSAAPDYIAALEDIRAITQGRGGEPRMMTWREAVELWEQQHGSDERARARFFVHIGIATTDECKLLDEQEDTP